MGYGSFNSLHAEVAQLVERNLAKVEVAGSSLVFRSKIPPLCGIFHFSPNAAARWAKRKRLALVVELVDTQDLKSCPTQVGCRFNSCRGHKSRSIDWLLIFLHANDNSRCPVLRSKIDIHSLRQ